MSSYAMKNYKKRRTSSKSSNRRYIENEKRKFRSQKVESSGVLFFIVHNILSASLFFILGILFNLMINIEDKISYLFSIDFLSIILLVFILSIFSGIAGRIFGYLLLNWYFKKYRKKEIKYFGDLNVGINKMLTYSWFLSLFLSSLVFGAGLLTIFQLKLFGNYSLVGLVIVYLITKIVIFLVVRSIVETKI